MTPHQIYSVLRLLHCIYYCMYLLVWYSFISLLLCDLYWVKEHFYASDLVSPIRLIEQLY